MTYRERVLSILNKKTPDKVPWFGDLDYWVNSMKLNGTLPQEYQADGYYKLHRDLGVGYYLQGYFPFDITYGGVEIEEKRFENTIHRTIRTPMGILEEERIFLPRSYSWACAKHLLEKAEDIPAFKYFIEHMSFSPNYIEAVKRKELVGNNGVILCYLPRSPFMELVTEYSGLQNLVYMISDFSEEICSLLEVMEHQSDKAAEISLASPAECLMIPENLSSEMIGVEYYQKFLRPYEKKWVNRIRQAGKYSFIHMDGTLKGLIGHVAETGFDVLEALTPLPSGDMSMADIGRTVPENTIVWGGLPGIVFTHHVTDLFFEDYVLGILEIMKSYPRFVLGVADQVPPNGMWDRVKKVGELVEKYGCY